MKHIYNLHKKVPWNKYLFHLQWHPNQSVYVRQRNFHIVDRQIRIYAWLSIGRNHFNWFNYKLFLTVFRKGCYLKKYNSMSQLTQWRREEIGLNRERHNELQFCTIVFKTIFAFVRSVAVHSINMFFVSSVMAECAPFIIGGKDKTVLSKQYNMSKIELNNIIWVE